MNFINLLPFAMTEGMAMGIPYLGMIVGVIITSLPIICIFYLCMKMLTTRHAEKMAMIEKGYVIADPPSNPNKGLQRGMLLFGLGVGTVVGAVAGVFMSSSSSHPGVIVAIFIGSILFFGGMGQVSGSLLARWLNKNDEKKNASSEQRIIKSE